MSGLFPNPIVSCQLELCKSEIAKKPTVPGWLYNVGLLLAIAHFLSCYNTVRKTGFLKKDSDQIKEIFLQNTVEYKIL